MSVWSFGTLGQYSYTIYGNHYLLPLGAYPPRPLFPKYVLGFALMIVMSKGLGVL